MRSVLEQGFPASEREVPVVDDGSSDGARKIKGKFAPQVRMLRKAIGGQASAFNTGIPECQRGDGCVFAPGRLLLPRHRPPFAANVELLGKNTDQEC